MAVASVVPWGNNNTGNKYWVSWELQLHVEQWHIYSGGYQFSLAQ